MSAIQVPAGAKFALLPVVVDELWFDVAPDSSDPTKPKPIPARVGDVLRIRMIHDLSGPLDPTLARLSATDPTAVSFAPGQDANGAYVDVTIKKAVPSLVLGIA